MAEGGKSAQEVFKETIPKIIGTLGQEPPFTIVTVSLSAEELITDQELEHIESKSAPAEKGKEITQKLRNKIKDSDDPVGCLLKICDVFESEDVDNETLRKHGAKMRSEVSRVSPAPPVEPITIVQPPRASGDSASSWFRSVSDRLASAITPSLIRVTGKLYAAGLIGHVLNDEMINGRDIDSRKAASLVNELQRALDNDANPVQYLNDICRVLRDVGERQITDIAIILSTGTSTAASTVLTSQATSHSVSPGIDTKIASKVLATSNDLMTKIDLMYLADKMVVKGVMTDDERRSIVDERMTGLSEVERKNKLLNILKDTVAVDGSIFTWFIQILIDYDTRLSKSIANKLKEKYDELLRTSSYFPSTEERLNPAAIFRSHFADIKGSIAARLDKALDEFYMASLIPQVLYDDVMSMGGPNSGKAAKITQELQRKIRDSPNPAERLEEVCQILLKLEDEKLNHIVEDIRSETGRSTQGGTTQEPQGEHGDEDTDSAVEPPKWTDNPKKYEKEDAPFTDDLTKDIKFLLMPATPAEEEQVLLYLEPKDESSDKYIKTSVNNIPLYIGKYGKKPVIVAMTAPAKDRQGPTQAAIIATIILNKIESIEYVVAVGVCFGIDKEKQDLGDVAISSIICDFVCEREGTTVYPRGPQDGVGDKILNIFKPPHNFKMPHEKNVHTGPVISTSNLIDNANVKARLVKFRPDAVGGEMEGSAINAAVKKKPPATCIIIKGIGDWGDGNKEGSKRWKPFAARAAAYYVKTALNKFSYSSDAAAISKESTMEEEESDAVVDTEVLDKAMKEGYVSLNNIKMVICGPPAVGKTAFQDLLLNKPPPQEYNSTPIARPIEAVQIAGDEDWKEVNEDDLLHMLSDAIEKACNTSSPEEESSTTSDTPSPAHEAVSSQEDTTSIEPSPKDAVLTTQASDDTTTSTSHQPTSNIATPKPSEVTTPSEVKILLKKLRKQLANVAKIKASQPQELLKAKWIHLLDSGGQPQFTDLLQMFVRDNSLYIIVMKATESLHDKPAFFYSVDGKPVRAPNDLTMTNLEIIEKSVRSIVAAPRDKTAVETSRSADNKSSNSERMFVILATHIDKLQSEDLDARLKEYNKEILERLDKFRDHFIFYEYESNELIFPVNNLCEEPDRQNKAAEIRNCLMPQSDKMSFNKKIPIRWYIFDILMKREALKKTHGMISFESCEVIGNECDMNPKMVKDCLKYLDSMRLCIYYSEVLPKMVFKNPQFLVDCLSKIVRVSFAKDLQKTLPEGAKSRSENGVFDESLLDNLGLTFIPDLFSKSDLLKLLKHFNVISPIKADDDTGTSQYFMPILLPPEHLTKEQKDCLEEKNDPLHITFKDKIFPKALFPMMVVSLLSRKDKPCFSIDCPSDDFPSQLRHAIKLYSEDLFGSIFLCEDYESIEVYFAVPRKHYYVLRKVILEALKDSAKKLGYDEEQLKVSAIVKPTEKHYILTSEVPSSVSPDEKSDTHDPASSTISFYDILERSICAEKDWEILGQTLEVKEDMKKIKDECYNQPPVCRKELMRRWFKTKGQNVTATQLDTVLPPSTEEKSSIDYEGVKGDYEILKKKFEAVFNSFVEEANTQLEKVKEAWLELIQDKLKNEAKAVSIMENEIKRVEDEESLRALLQQYCFLSNTLLLKHIADKLDLTESKERIDELDDEREGFYTSLLAEDFVEIEDHKKIDNHKEITFKLEGSSEIMLEDFILFLKEEYDDLSMFMSLRAVHRGSLIMIIGIPSFVAGILITGMATIIYYKRITPNGEPPEWSDNPIKYEKEVVPFTDDLTKNIKFLLMPATPVEEKQVLLYLEPKDESSDKYIKTSIDDITLYIGKYGKKPVIVVMTAPDKDKQGPIHATFVATTILTKIKSIEYVVAVGVCFGINKEKQQLGDVVISSIICDFTSKREGTTVHPRGAQNAVEDKILNIFRPSYDFEMPHNNNKPITGPIISQPDLIDNAAVKARLVKKREDAIGGEMEGAAIMAVTKRKREPQATCIVIKGIGDWADGEKEGSKEWKKYAARAAAYYVKAALNEFRSD